MNDKWVITSQEKTAGRVAAGAGQSAMQQRHHVPLVSFLCHRFFSVLSQGRHISDVSPHGQETSAVVEGTMSGGQARKRVLLPLESPAGLPPVWSSSPGSSLMAVLKLITGRRRKPPHLA